MAVRRLPGGSEGIKARCIYYINWLSIPYGDGCHLEDVCVVFYDQVVC